MHTRGKVTGAAIVALLVLGSAACSGSSSGSSPSTPGSRSDTPTTIAAPAKPAALVLRGHTYQVPDPLPAGKPGTVLATEQQVPAPRLADAQRTRFLYLSEDHAGRASAASGVLLVPKGTAPKGGWPVIAWGHGTTGVADVCAPSQTDNLFYNEYAQEASSFLEAGYAVVATDYIGLGTPGMHGYLVGRDEGNAVVDSVRAARQLSPELSKDWFAVGHSQGGQAALFATTSAKRAPELTLRGAVAIAPASGLEAALPAITQGAVPADLVYGTYAIAGLTTVDDTVTLKDELGPAGLANYELITEGGCLLDTLPKLGAVQVDDIFAMTPERTADLSARIGRYGDPERAGTKGPVLVVQGETDVDVPAGLTDRMVDVLQAKGDDVELRLYPKRNHDQVLGPSICDVLGWLAAHGGTSADGCTPYETDLT